MPDTCDACALDEFRVEQEDEDKDGLSHFCTGLIGRTEEAMQYGAFHVPYGAPRTRNVGVVMRGNRQSVTKAGRTIRSISALHLNHTTSKKIRAVSCASC